MFRPNVFIVIFVTKLKTCHYRNQELTTFSEVLVTEVLYLFNDFPEELRTVSSFHRFFSALLNGFLHQTATRQIFEPGEDIVDAFPYYYAHISTAFI